MTDLQALVKARDILNRAATPLDLDGAWMSKDTYISLGGSAETWEVNYGDETVAYVSKQ